MTCLATQQGTQEPGFKPKSVELQSPHIFSKEKKQEVVLSNEGPQVKSGVSSPVGAARAGEAPRVYPLMALGHWPTR